MRRPYISKTVFTTLFAILGFWVIEAQPAAAHSGRVLSAYAPGPFACETVTLSDPAGAGWPSVACVMNDAANLYIRLAVTGLSADTRDGWAFFDNNHDGLADVGEDGLRIKNGFGFVDFSDLFRTTGPSFELIQYWMDDINDGGTEDGSGTSFVVGDVTYFDFVHPLSSLDSAHDIKAKCDSPRMVIGADWGAHDFFPGSTKEEFVYPIGNPVTDTGAPKTWDDIVIACQGDPRQSPMQTHNAGLQTMIAQLPDAVFRNGLTELRDTLVSKVGVIGQMLDAGNLLPAVQKLANDILPKLNPASKSCWVCGVSPEPSIVYLSALELLAEIEAVQGVSPEPSLPFSGDSPEPALQ